MAMTSTNAPTLLVLAAGMGSRYGGLKQIDSVGPNGETIVDYSIFDALRGGFEKVIFIIRKDIEQQFKEVVGARFEKQVEVGYVYQELDKLPQSFSVPEGRTKPWGTTQAVLMAADAIKGSFAVINADDFYGEKSYRVLAQHLRAGTADYAMVGFILRNTLSEFGSVARGICRVDPDNYLEQVVELTSIKPNGDVIENTDPADLVTRLTGDELVSMNMWGFTPSVYPHLEQQFESFLGRDGSSLKSECYLPSTVNSIVAAGQAKVKVLSTSDAWFGVTYREDHPLVVESIGDLIEKGSYPRRLWV